MALRIPCGYPSKVAGRDSLPKNPGLYRGKDRVSEQMRRPFGWNETRGRIEDPSIHPVSASWTALFRILGRTGSGGEDLAAFGTAAREDLTAVGGGHSLAETMHFGSVTLLGLIGTQHWDNTSCQD